MGLIGILRMLCLRALLSSCVRMLAVKAHNSVLIHLLHHLHYNCIESPHQTKRDAFREVNASNSRII
jgi:hypothetical protein